VAKPFVVLATLSCVLIQRNNHDLFIIFSGTVVMNRPKFYAGRS